MHLWQHEAQLGFCFRLGLTTLGQANMFCVENLSQVFSLDLWLCWNFYHLPFAISCKHLPLDSHGFILLRNATNIYSTFLQSLTYTDMYEHGNWRWSSVLTWPGGAHFLLRLLLYPVARASCEQNPDFWGWRIRKDWRRLERWHTVKVPEPLKKFSCVLGLLNSPYPVPLQPFSLWKFCGYHRMGPKVSIHQLLSTWSGAFMRSSLAKFVFFDNVL